MGADDSDEDGSIGYSCDGEQTEGEGVRYGAGGCSDRGNIFVSGMESTTGVRIGMSEDSTTW